MRKLLILIIISSFFFSCAEDPKEIAIKNKEQNIDGTITDLNLNIISMEQTGKIFAKDSIEIVTKEYDLIKQETLIGINSLIDSYIYLIKTYEKNQSTYKKDLNSPYKDIREIGNEGYERTSLGINKTQQELDNLVLEMLNVENDSINENPSNNDFKKLNKYLETIERLNLDSTKVLSVIYRVQYSINNPFLNGVKQTLTKDYYFKNDSIVKSVKI